MNSVAVSDVPPLCPKCECGVPPMPWQAVVENQHTQRRRLFNLDIELLDQLVVFGDFLAQVVGKFA